MSDTKLEWDGEKVKQVTVSKEHKFSPKDIIDSLAGLRSQRDQTLSSKEQAKKTIIASDKNLKSMDENEARLKPFEDKCIELQKEKLQLYIKQLHKECMDKALLDAKETIAKDPSAYQDNFEPKLSYLNYQKALATNKKIAENISRGIIIQYLFDTPVFDNPFLTTGKD